MGWEGSEASAAAVVVAVVAVAVAVVVAVAVAVAVACKNLARKSARYARHQITTEKR